MAKRFANGFIYLNLGNKAINCRSRINCMICNGKRHVSLCNKSSSSSGSGSNNAIELPAAPKDGPSPAHSTLLDPNTTFWVGNTTSGSKLALLTALANIDEKKEGKVRVLFDPRSQKSFVAAKVVSELGLNSVRKESLGIRAFG